LLRLLFLLLALCGAGLAFAYPAVIGSGEEVSIERLRLHDTAEGFQPRQAALHADQAPAYLSLVVAASVPPQAAPDATIVTLSVTADDGTARSESFPLSAARITEDSPQTPYKFYVYDAGALPVIKDGTFVFTAGTGSLDAAGLVSVDLDLTRRPPGVDERAKPLGFVLLVLGGIGFVNSFRRRPAASIDTATPRWGRGPGQDSGGAG
jgi:hypothetical protein